MFSSGVKALAPAAKTALKASGQALKAASKSQLAKEIKNVGIDALAQSSIAALSGEDPTAHLGDSVTDAKSKIIDAIKDQANKRKSSSVAAAASVYEPKTKQRRRKKKKSVLAAQAKKDFDLLEDSS